MRSVAGGGEPLRIGTACRAERRGEDGGELWGELFDSRLFGWREGRNRRDDQWKQLSLE